LLFPANSNLDGTGTLGVLISGGLDVGTLIKRIIIKAQENTTQGMIRLFFRPYNNTNTVVRLRCEPYPIAVNEGPEPGEENEGLPEFEILIDAWREEWMDEEPPEEPRVSSGDYPPLT